MITDLDPEDAAGLLEELRDDLAAELLADLPYDAAARVLAEMPPEEAVDVLAVVDDEARVGALLDHMPDEPADEIRRLLEFAPDSAGGLMTTDIAMLPVGLTAGEAIERIRGLHDELEDLSYVYIVDEDHRLEGVLSFRDLVFKRPGAGLDEVMVRNPISVQTDTDREIVAELATRYHLFGLPVVDETGRLVGMVTTESVIESIQEEATEDFAASVGAGADETVYSAVASSVRMRLPWLVLNLALAMGVAFVIESQTGIIGREPVLAALMPVIAVLGGNGGSQSLAVVIRALATDDLPPSRSREIVGRQVRVGTINGGALAMLSGTLCLVLLDTGIFPSSTASARVALVVGIAALVNLAIGAALGATIPLGLRKAGLDPALASSILLTFTTDLVGFGGFLLMASAFL